MSKTTEQIAKDCNLTSGQASLLYGIMMRPEGDDATVIGAQDNIIGALYRRIEKLEEVKFSSMVALEAAFDEACAANNNQPLIDTIDAALAATKA